MIRPGFDAGPPLDSFRAMYRAAIFPSVVVPELLDPDAAAALRVRLEMAGLQPFFVADRGRYAFNATLTDEPLFERLRQFAALVVGAPLRVGPARWLRLGRGDYSLIRGDARGRVEPERHLELTADFSSGSTDQAEIVYSDGQASVVIPQWAGSLALVDKPKSLYRYERYLTHQVGSQEVYRLRLVLRYE
jgi:hypothetical protein